LSDDSERTCVEDPKAAEIRKSIQVFEKRFNLYLALSVVYGFFFINYIDLSISGSGHEGYHLWLVFMYFFPFLVLTVLFPRNWQLTIGLGLLASLMNDVFYGLVANFMGIDINLGWYYSLWLIPSGTTLFDLNLGITVIPVYSWMMALSIYGRIAIVILLLWSWKSQAKIRCINQPRTKLGFLEDFWKRIPKIYNFFH
jgi:hypothetical protein